MRLGRQRNVLFPSCSRASRPSASSSHSSNGSAFSAASDAANNCPERGAAANRDRISLFVRLAFHGQLVRVNVNPGSVDLNGLQGQAEHGRFRQATRRPRIDHGSPCACMLWNNSLPADNHRFRHRRVKRVSCVAVAAGNRRVQDHMGN